MPFFFFTAYCLFKSLLYRLRGALKVTASWHGHDNMTDSRLPPSACSSRDLSPRCPEDFGVCFPQHMSLCQLENVKPRSRLAYKVPLTQVPYKVVGARDKCAFFFTGRLLSINNNNPAEIRKDEGVSERRSAAPRLWFHVVIHDLHKTFIIFLTRPFSYGVLSSSTELRGPTMRAFRSTSACHCKSRLQVFIQINFSVIWWHRPIKAC